MNKREQCNGQAGTLLKKPVLESQNNALYQIRKLVEGCDNRLVLNHLRIAERYAGADCEIVIDILPCGVCHDGGTVFIKRDPLRHTESVVSAARGLEGYLAGPVPAKGSKGHQGLVFVFDGKSAQRPKKIIPSLVRFQGRNHGLGVWVKKLYFSLWTLSFKFIHAPSEGEIHLRDIRCTVRNGEAASEIVQSIPEVVDSVADRDIDIVGQRSNQFDYDGFFRACRIDLLEMDNGVRLSENEIVKQRLDISDVLIGPLDLRF